MVSIPLLLRYGKEIEVSQRFRRLPLLRCVSSSLVRLYQSFYLFIFMLSLCLLSWPKFFPEFGWFRGKVTKVDFDEGLYLIGYDDGDQEEMDDEELCKRACSVPPEAVVPPVRLLPNWNDSLNLWKVHGLESSSSFKIPGWTDNAHDAVRLNRHAAVKVADFFLFISERQRVWERRKIGLLKPWSACPIFQEYSFCNNYRELDRGTQYFHAHVLKLRRKFPNSTRSQWIRLVLFASYTYRQVNRIASFIELGIPEECEVERFIEGMISFQERKMPFFSAAHQTTNFSTFRSALKVITDNEGRTLKLVSNEISQADNDKRCISLIRTLPLVGPFFAWQIFCDLHESKCLQIFGGNFCELGPGALGKPLLPHSVSFRHRLLSFPYHHFH